MRPRGRWIRAIRVTPPQRKSLAAGRLAIVRGDRHEFDFPLIPRKIAVKLAELAPDRVLLLHPEGDGSDETGADEASPLGGRNGIARQSGGDDPL